MAADVAVDLRFPHRGEVSGSLSMAMVAGMPTIVSATGTYLDIPEDLVVRDRSGTGRPAELAQRILELRDDPERRARIGAAARAHMAALRAADATARGYEEAILATQCDRRRSHPADARPLGGEPRRLGIDDALVQEGYGVSYARALESFERTP